MGVFAGRTDTAWKGCWAMPSETPEGLTVLLVDDDEGLADVVRLSLERCGCRVLSARDGAEALTVFRRHQEQVDVAMVDLRLPDMTGADLVEQLHAISDLIPIVASSGDHYDAPREAMEAGAVQFIGKPFTLSGLPRQLSDAMDSAAT